MKNEFHDTDGLVSYNWLAERKMCIDPSEHCVVIKKVGTKTHFCAPIGQVLEVKNAFVLLAVDNPDILETPHPGKLSSNSVPNYGQNITRKKVKKWPVKLTPHNPSGYVI